MEALREVGKSKRLENSASIQYVQFVEDTTLHLHNTENFSKKLIIALHTKKNTWSFRRIADFQNELFEINSSDYSQWGLYKVQTKLFLWNQLVDRDKLYFEIIKMKDHLILGQKFKGYGPVFDELTMKNTHLMDRDMFVDIDRQDKQVSLFKDKEKLKVFIYETLEEEYTSEDSKTNSCVLLTYNKVEDYYVLIHSDRINKQVSMIQSTVMNDKMSKSEHQSASKLVHGHFDNLRFEMNLNKCKIVVDDGGQKY